MFFVFVFAFVFVLFYPKLNEANPELLKEIKWMMAKTQECLGFVVGVGVGGGDGDGVGGFCKGFVI